VVAIKGGVSGLGRDSVFFFQGPFSQMHNQRLGGKTGSEHARR